MQHVKTFLLLALLGVCQLGMLYAQPQKVIFKSGTRVLPENASEMIRQPHIDPQEVFRHTYYRYLQFQEIPRQSRREQLERSGIILLSYIPNNTYLAAIPENYDLGQLAGYNLRSISPVAPTDKIDPLLTAEPYPDWALSGDRIQLVIRYHEGLKESEVRDALLGAGVSILKSST